jgi:hypothetical protein
MYDASRWLSLLFEDLINVLIEDLEETSGELCTHVEFSLLSKLSTMQTCVNP